MNILDRLILSVFEVFPAKSLFLGFYASTRQLSFFDSVLKGSEKVLDVGCGLGFTGEYLTRKGFSVVGLELDHELVRRVKKYASYELHASGATDIPYPNASFDAVLFMYVFHHIPTKHHREALGEAARVLKEGGKLILVEPRIDSKFDLAWDRIFFSDSFYEYFGVEGSFNLNEKGGARIYEVKKEDIPDLKFLYPRGSEPN